jgi:hypothetical protein
VKVGRIMLLGVVNNEGDMRVADMRAREVEGAFGVENLLVVDTDSGARIPNNAVGDRLAATRVVLIVEDYAAHRSEVVPTTPRRRPVAP